MSGGGKPNPRYVFTGLVCDFQPYQPPAISTDLAEETAARVLDVPVAEAEISVMVHHDEAAYLEASSRCGACGHLVVLHELAGFVGRDEIERYCPLCEGEPCREGA